MTSYYLVNIGSVHDFVPDDTKPSPEPMLTYHRHGLFGIHLMAISQEMRKIYSLSISLKMINLRLEAHLPGSNELNSLL